MTGRAVLFVLLGGLACGGGGSDGGSGPNPPPVTVTVTPTRDTLTVGTSATFGATVANSGDPGVSWTVVGSGSAGSVSAAGIYTAGTTPQTVLLIAASDSVPTVKDTALVQVVAAPNATMTVGDSVLEQQAGLAASVPSQSGMTYTWTVTGGTLGSGQGTAAITYTAGAPGGAQVGVTVRNLADSAVTVVRGVTIVPAPAISSFTVARDTVTTGEGTTLTATFVHGAGSISQGVGAVTSGAVTPVGPFLTPYVPTTYQLTVTGFRGATSTAQVTAVAVHPPVLSEFRALTTRVPVGGHGLLQVGWNHDPGVQVSLDPGAIPVLSSPVQTPNLAAAGVVTFTATVRSPADSILTDTASLTAVMPAAGSFTAAGVMDSGRIGGGIAELLDGRVLIAGGNNFIAGGLRGAELFDPATGQFTATGMMLHPRSFPLAVTLDDGRVLVAGFDDLLNPTTELYDPATGQFSAGPNTHGAGLQGMRKLSDGRVFLLTGTAPANYAELFDPVGNTVSVTDSIIPSRNGPGVVPLPNDQVLIVGGLELGTGDVATALVYDPTTGHFTPTGSLAAVRPQGTYTALQDGRVLAAGGVAGGVLITGAELYDPGTGQWSGTGALATPRFGHGAVLLGDGRILLVTGIGDGIGIPEYAESFDPNTGVFTPLAGSVHGGRTLPNLLRLSDGRVLLTGGSVTGGVTNVTDLFQ